MAHRSPAGRSTSVLRIIVLLVLLVGLGVVGYLTYVDDEGALDLFGEADPGSSSSSNSHGQAGPSGVVELSPESWSSTLRLSPDRRFLDGLSHIDHLVGDGAEAKAPAVDAEYTDQMWVVTHNGQQAGKLDPLPDAKSMTELLDAYAREKLASEPASAAAGGELDAIDEAIEGFHPPRLFEALAEINAAAEQEPLSGRLALATARALTYLLAQTNDPLELVDPVASRALAALAVAHQDDSLDAQRIRQVEALLMATLGYTGRADALAKGLDAAHPVAAFVRRDQHALDKRAKDSELARFLLLRLAEQRTDESLWKRSVRRHFDSKLPSAAALATARTFVSFRAMPHVQSSVRDRLVTELRGQPSTFDADSLPVEERDDGRKRLATKLLRSQLATLFAADGAEFDEATEEAAERYGGHVFSGELVEAYARSMYLGSAYGEGLFYIDALSAPKIAKARIDRLRADGPGAEALLREYLHLRLAHSRQRADPGALRGAIDANAPLGGRVVTASYGMFAEHADWGSPDNLRLVRRLPGHLDSRLEHRADFGAELYRWAWEVPTADRLVLSLMDAAPVRYRSQIGWYARRNGDLVALERLMKQAPATSEELLPLLQWYLKLDEASPQVAKRQFDRLLTAEPALWSVRKEHSEFFFDQKAYADAEEVVASWLREHGPGLGLEEIFARIRISRARRLSGDAAGAWKAIAPKITSQQAGAMVEGARVLEAQGEFGRAETLYRKTVQRYPNTTWTRAALAGFLWRRGEFQQAATILKRAPSHHDYDWSKYVDAFVEAFEGREVAQMVGALEAMQQAGLPPLKLRGVAGRFARNEQWAHAFEISRRLRFRQMMAAAENTMNTYGYLEQAEGEQRARQWLEEQPAAKRPGILGMMAFQEGHDQLLWELLADPPDNDVGHATWTFRAAAYRRAGDEHPERRRRLEEYYARPSSNWYHRLGQLVWTGEGKEQLLTDATTAKKKCEVAYWIGLAAQLDHDYEAASEWYHLTMLTGATNNGEYHWAADELFGWVDNRRSYSLARLEREKPSLIHARATAPSD